MSTEVAKAAVNEALELSYMFRQNAALKHGLPECQRQQIRGEIPVSETPTAPAATESPSPGQPTEADAVKSSLLRRIAPWLLIGATGAGGGALGGWLIAKNQPATVEHVNEGLLLPWLEENGKHLPEEEQWQK